MPRRDVVLLWVVFAGGTAPGLLLFAHAVPVARDLQLSLRAAGLAVSALAAGNLVGRLVAGAWSDRIGRLPAVAVALSTGAVAIVALALPTSLPVVLAGYLGTGLAYGAVSALVPAATADRVGAAAFPTAYGVVFTGWGCAGLLAPLVGGQLLGLTERRACPADPGGDAAHRCGGRGIAAGRTGPRAGAIVIEARSWPHRAQR